MDAVFSGMYLVVIFFVFYLLIFRPQRQQKKRHAEMLASLKSGDKILTNGGFVCKIVRQDEHYVTIRLGNTTAKLSKDYIINKIEIDDIPDGNDHIEPKNNKRHPKPDSEIR